MLQSHTVQVCPSTNYERHLVLQAFQRLGVLVVDENTDSSDPALALMWAKPRDINWTRALDGSLVVSSYMLHSALTRKADLARCLQRRQRKHQQSHAALSMPLTYIIDADDCESDAGSIPGDLQAAWSAVEREGGLWLLKSSDSNRGENIFVIEPTASGRQQLFNTDAGQLDNKLVHATNYAVQARHGGGRCTAPSMLLSEACALWSTDAELQHTAEALESHITQQLEEIVRDTFEAAKAYPPGFFPLANCFQLFGFDFMLDRSLRLHLLEVNCDPSLSIFGDHHRPACQQLLDDMALADYEDVRWDKVLDGSLTSNHYYNRRCLLGSPARLAQLYLLIQRQQQQPASTAQPGRVAELARVLHGKSWRMTPLASPGSSRPLEHTVLPGKEVLDALQRQTRAGSQQQHLHSLLLQ
ncbi:hypothetical protein WJX72_002205 [[Myrmecia] bisecta]|uniref:Tubulin--tyrosine ligase-like protein 5 n=1 Tax=[Myrmecia] bisecta TaxID=41462 RepID=A0AAW1P8V2_9CHLO